MESTEARLFFVNFDFIRRMQAELEDNQHKGNWREWNPGMPEAHRELWHHTVKLAQALGRLGGSPGLEQRHFALGETRDAVAEQAADLANICMKIFEIFGTPVVPSTTTETTAPDTTSEHAAQRGAPVKPAETESTI